MTDVDDDREQPATCGCRPGTAADGWREVRSEPCWRAELAGWEREVLDRAAEAAREAFAAARGARADDYVLVK